MKLLTWILRIVTALILLQTLFYKFTAHPDSVYIFSKIGLEPWGRIGIGILELLTAIIILVPGTTHLGAILGLGILGGAIFFHFTSLGIVVRNDGGWLFFLALLTFTLCLVLLFIHRKKLLYFIKTRQIKL